MSDNHMIPEAAVEAAVKAVVDAMIEYGPDGHADGAEEITRAALDAAAPHIMAAAKFEAWEEGLSYALPGTQRGLDTFDEIRTANPYRPTP